MSENCLCSFAVCIDKEPPSGIKVLFMAVVGLASTVIGIFGGWFKMSFALLLPVAGWLFMKKQTGFDIIETKKGIINVVIWKRFLGGKTILSEKEVSKKEIKCLHIERFKTAHKLSLLLINKSKVQLIEIEHKRHAELPIEMLKSSLNCKVETQFLQEL
jgi:hypothetical protein